MKERKDFNTKKEAFLKSIISKNPESINIKELSYLL